MIVDPTSKTMALIVLTMPVVFFIGVVIFMLYDTFRKD